MKIRTWMVPIAIVGILGGSIVIAAVAGYWQTEGRGIGDGLHSDSSYSEESDDGIAITGSTTITEVLGKGVEAAALEALIGTWGDDGDTVRDISRANGYSFGQVKEAVAQLME